MSTNDPKSKTATFDIAVTAANIILTAVNVSLIVVLFLRGVL